MPVRQLSNASSAARAISIRDTTTSTVRVLVIARGFFCLFNGHPGLRSQERARDGPWPVPARVALFRDEARFVHQARIELVVLLEEFQHVLAGEKRRLERLLFEV